MQFTTPARPLIAAVRYAAKWLVAKPASPEQGGVLFEVTNGRLSVTGFNENATGRASLPVEGEDDRYVVAGRLIAALVETFPDKPITFEQTDGMVAVTSGKFRATLPVMSASDYPGLPGEAPAVGTAVGTELADAVRRVAVATSRNLESRVSLTGIFLSFGLHQGDPLTMIGTDSLRATMQTLDWTGDDSGAALDEAAIIPAVVLVDAADAFDGPDTVTIGWQPGRFSLTTADRSLVTRTLGDPAKPETEFPVHGLRKLFAKALPAEAVLDSRDMAMPIKRANLLRDKNSEMVRLTFGENLITLTSRSEVSGGDEEIDAKYAGEPCTMWLHSGLLHAALASAPGDQVVVSFNPESMRRTRPEAIVITSPADATWRHLLMPIKPS